MIEGRQETEETSPSFGGTELRQLQKALIANGEPEEKNHIHVLEVMAVDRYSFSNFIVRPQPALPWTKYVINSRGTMR